MKIKIIILLFISVFISCNHKSKSKSENISVEYYSNDSVFRRTTHYINFDSVFYFYRNGKLFKKGKQLNDSQKIGKWMLFDDMGNLREIREWFPYKGNSRLNRVWHLDSKGDTLAWRTEDDIYKQKEFVNDTIGRRATSYDIIYFNKDTIKLNEPVIGYIEIGSHTITDYPANLRVLLATEKENYNYDFSNEKEVRLDTFYDLSIDTVNQKWFRGAKFRDLTTFGQWYDDTGEKTIRGFYQQFYIGPAESDEKNMIIDSVIGPKTFFEHKVVVIDSIDNQ